MNYAVYFAHPVNTYGKPIEQTVLAMIVARFPGIEIVNPNSSEHERAYKEQGMDYFVRLIDKTSVTIILPFSDGTIGAGIAKEAHRAKSNCAQVLFVRPRELDMILLEDVSELPALSVENTRARLKSGIEEIYGI